MKNARPAGCRLQQATTLERTGEPDVPIPARIPASTAARTGSKASDATQQGRDARGAREQPVSRPPGPERRLPCSPRATARPAAAERAASGGRSGARRRWLPLRTRRRRRPAPASRPRRPRRRMPASRGEADPRQGQPVVRASRRRSVARRCQQVARARGQSRAPTSVGSMSGGQPPAPGARTGCGRSPYGRS